VHWLSGGESASFVRFQNCVGEAGVEVDDLCLEHMARVIVSCVDSDRGKTLLGAGRDVEVLESFAEAVLRLVELPFRVHLQVFVAVGLAGVVVDAETLEHATFEWSRSVELISLKALQKAREAESEINALISGVERSIVDGR